MNLWKALRLEIKSRMDLMFFIKDKIRWRKNNEDTGEYYDRFRHCLIRGFTEIDVRIS